MNAEWTGPVCCMCNGSGSDFRYVLEPSGDGVTYRVIDRVPTDRPCRACNGHGRDAA